MPAARRPGKATIASRTTAASGPSHSPRTTTGGGGVLRGSTETLSAVRSCTPADATTSPAGVIDAEMPVVVVRSCGRRVSTLRNAETTRCRYGPRPSPNQLSFEMVSSSSAPRRTASRASVGWTAS
jgi:hypothetical protein